MPSISPMRAVVAVLAALLALLTAVGLAGQAAAAVSDARQDAASGSTSTDWERLAKCESGGRWDINTGNGYYGGLQMTRATWASYGGHRYAPRADLATPEQQIAVGERIVRSRGLRPWPVCGFRGQSFTSRHATRPMLLSKHHTAAAPAHPASHPVPAEAKRSAPMLSLLPVQVPSPKASHWTVRSGDSLSAIAAHEHIRGGWKALYDLNRDTLGGHPNLISPGQHLRLTS
jgi:resuscitation-promoting factor RpfA